MAGHFSRSDEAHLSTSGQEDAPPAYEDLSRIQSMAAGDISRPPSSVFSDASLTDDITLDKAANPRRPFPVTFNLYAAHDWKAWKTRRFHLGEHADQPTNALIFQATWKGNNMSLHQTPDKDSPVIATGARDSTWSKHSAITIPEHTGPDGDILKTQLHTNIAWKSGTVTYSFTVETIGPDEKPREEAFEWRLSHGKEVRDIDKRAWGYKLVRLGDSEPGSSSGKEDVQAGSSRAERKHGMTSDGKEVVAVYADRSKASKNKFARFMFVGSGATGQFGERWAVMAVATFVRVWQSVHPELSGGV